MRKTGRQGDGGEKHTLEESIVSDMRQASRQGDGGKTFTTVKSTVLDMCQAGRQGDGGKTFTPVKSPIPDMHQTSRQGDGSEKHTPEEIEHILKYEAGLLAHLGTSDCREVERRIEAGDKHARLIYDAMCLGIAKNIACAAVSARGQIDQIILTGGMAFSKYITDYVADHVRFIAPVTVYPGENEMHALAMGVLRVLRCEEDAKEYRD